MVGSVGSGVGTGSWIRLALELKKRASANNRDGLARLACAPSGMSACPDDVPCASRASVEAAIGAGADAGLDADIDQIWTADSSALAALRRTATAGCAAPFRSGSLAPDDSKSIILGIQATRTTWRAG
jgi:hypothetical protein